MAETLTSLLVHVVFSTKDRADLITPEIEPRLFSYFGGIARKMDSRLIDAGGTSNHVHLLISQSKNVALANLLQELKKSSSQWIKGQGSEFAKFHWQDGYGGFSIGASQIPQVKSYLAKQKHHHRKITFQEEYLEFLKKYEIRYNEKYLWR
ncbi:MAG TPA: IS200/IS605 family transposase [Blastocatellia bacterium]|nr:IS200/IS605 family transposase [Blastocatellia bacterium]